jgi:polar amino acid transport system permease protein
LSFPAQLYIDVFRGTPLLVQIIFIYFATPLIGLRFESLFFAGLTALTLNSAAYVAEIFRSGIQSIDRGQMEAGRASGLSYGQTMRYIVVPQAFRRVIPPLVNEFIALLKDSSLVSVLTVLELTKQTQIFATNIGSWVVPGLLCAVLYLAMSLPLAALARRLERRWKSATA